MNRKNLLSKKAKQISRAFENFHILKVLSYPPYFYFSLSVIFSQIAFNMMNIILIFLVFYLTSSNFAVSMLILIFLIPQIIFSFIGGIVADHISKPKILVFGNILRALALVVLFFNIQSVFVMYLVALAIAIITQFYVPAEPPLIPHLVGRKQLIAANSIFGLNLFGSILIAYVLAGPALTLLGRTHVFILLSILFLIASVSAFSIPPEKTKTGGLSLKHLLKDLKNAVRREFLDSYAILRKSGKLRGAFFLLIFSQVIILVLATVIPGYAKGILQVPTEDVSLLVFAPAAFGLMFSALLIGGVNSVKSKDNLMNYGLFLSGFVLLLFPFITSIAHSEVIGTLNTLLPARLEVDVLSLALVISFFAGVGNAMVFVPSQAIIQEMAPENFRSKIYGLLFALVGVFSLVPVILAGGLADIFGVGSVLMGIGLSIATVGLIRVQLLAHHVSIFRRIVNLIKR